MEVRITGTAKELFTKLAAAGGFDVPGLMVHRLGPTGDVARTSDGSAVWSIERPQLAWKVRLGELASFGQDDQEVVVVEGIRIWLPMIPKPGEKGLEIDVRNGELVAATLR